MNSVATSAPPVNDPKPKRTLDDVIAFVEHQTKLGDMADTSSRLGLTGLRALIRVIDSSEPGTPEWVLDNMDQLLDRCVRRNSENMKSDTARTYGSRARTCIRAFLRWDADPTGYRPNAARPAKGDKKKVEKKAPLAVAPQVIVVPPEPQVPAAPAAPAAKAAAPDEEYVRKAQAGDMRGLPLGPGRDDFRYVLPQDGLMLIDVRRIMFHLITMATDYDMMATPMEVLSQMMQPQAPRQPRPARTQREE